MPEFGDEHPADEHFGISNISDDPPSILTDFDAEAIDTLIAIDTENKAHNDLKFSKEHADFFLNIDDGPTEYIIPFEEEQPPMRKRKYPNDQHLQQPPQLSDTMSVADSRLTYQTAAHVNADSGHHQKLPSYSCRTQTQADLLPGTRRFFKRVRFAARCPTAAEMWQQEFDANVAGLKAAKRVRFDLKPKPIQSLLDSSLDQR